MCFFLLLCFVDEQNLIETQPICWWVRVTIKKTACFFDVVQIGDIDTDSRRWPCHWLCSLHIAAISQSAASAASSSWSYPYHLMIVIHTYYCCSGLTVVKKNSRSFDHHQHHQQQSNSLVGQVSTRSDSFLVIRWTNGVLGYWWFFLSSITNHI